MNVLADLLNGMDPTRWHLYLLQLGIVLVLGGWMFRKQANSLVRVLFWSCTYLFLGWISAMSMNGALVSVMLGLVLGLSQMREEEHRSKYMMLAIVATICGLGYVLLALPLSLLAMVSASGKGKE